MTDDRDDGERPERREPSHPDWPTQDFGAPQPSDAPPEGDVTDAPHQDPAEARWPWQESRPFWETPEGAPDASRWRTSRPFWETEGEPQRAPVAEPEPEREPEPRPESEPATEQEPEAVAEGEAEPEPALEPDPESQSEPEPALDAEPDALPVEPPPAEPESAPGLEPAPEAAAGKPAEPKPEPEPTRGPERSFRRERDRRQDAVAAAAAAAALAAEPAEAGSVEPEQPVASEPVPEPDTQSGPTTTRWDRRAMGERRKPTTAEHAVPWLIGLVLALAGIVLVLLALIFTSENGIGVNSSPTPRASGSVPAILPSGSAVPSGTPPASATTSAAATPTQAPTPEYGALEMVYLSRSTATAPIYLYRRDFSVDEEAETLAHAEQGVEQFAWSADGRRGAAIISGRAVAIQQQRAARALADGVTEIAFAPDSTTLYAARVARDGGNDVAQVLAIDWESGTQEIIASVTYPHPQVAAESALDEAQFIDDGGQVRLYPLTDGHVMLWILGAPATYEIDPPSKEVTETTGLPALWSPDELFRVTLAEGDPNTLILADAQGNERAATKVAGKISHLRWAPNSSEVAFTVGRLGANGGIVQNLYVWDLVDGKEPTMLTSNGASFGAEWRGGAVRWVREPAT